MVSPKYSELAFQELNISLSTDGVVKEGRPKFNLRPGRGLKPGPPGSQSAILPTVLNSCGNLANVTDTCEPN